MDKEAFRNFLQLLTPRQKRKGMAVIFLVSFNSLLDFITIASFLPLIFLLTDRSLVNSNGIAKKIFEAGGFTSYQSFIILITLVIAGLVVAKNFASLWIAGIKSKYAFSLGSEISMRALEQYMKMNYQEFTHADHSRELNRIANQPFALANNIVLPLTTLLSEIMVCLFIIAAITFYNWKILLLLAVIILPVSLLFQMRKKALKKISFELNDSHPRLLKYALQVIEGLFEIKLAAGESFFKDRYKKLSTRLASIFVHDHRIQTATSRMTEIVAATLMGLLIIYAVSTQQNFQQTILLLSVYAGASFRMIPSFNRILNSLSQLRMHEYVVHELKFAGALKKDQPVDEKPLSGFHEKIEVRDISFSYPGNSSVLENVSFTIQKGEKIAITGKSGQGKTTLLQILAGFLKTDSGKIIVDSNPVDSLPAATTVGYVSQNPYIIDGTLAENIAFGRSVEERNSLKITELLTTLGLSSLIDVRDDGIDSPIGEKGIKLSGGQRQRIALARALYSDVEVLLLDEVTNQLDPGLELEIISILNQLSVKGKTIIMITHKVVDSAFFDKICELTTGRIHAAPQKT